MAQGCHGIPALSLAPVIYIVYGLIKQPAMQQGCPGILASFLSLLDRGIKLLCHFIYIFFFKLLLLCFFILIARICPITLFNTESFKNGLLQQFFSYYFSWKKIK